MVPRGQSATSMVEKVLASTSISACRRAVKRTSHASLCQRGLPLPTSPRGLRLPARDCHQLLCDMLDGGRILLALEEDGVERAVRRHPRLVDRNGNPPCGGIEMARVDCPSPFGRFG